MLLAYTTSSNILIVDHNSVKGGFRKLMIALFYKSVECWCPNTNSIFQSVLTTILGFETIGSIDLYARQKDANAHIILPGAHRSARHVRRTFDTCFTLSTRFIICMFYLSKEFHTKQDLVNRISYPAIVFTMVIGLLNCGSFIVHILLLGTRKVFTLSVFLPCACVHVLHARHTTVYEAL